MKWKEKSTFSTPQMSTEYVWVTRPCLSTLLLSFRIMNLPLHCAAVVIFVSFLSHCCILFASWMHYWKHYSTRERFMFFFPFLLKAMAARKACGGFKMLLIVRCSSLQYCAAVSYLFNPVCLLCSLDFQHGGGKPASTDNLMVPVLERWGQQ